VRISYLPVLGTLRDLYSLPRDFERFRHYLALLLGGTDDVVLPIALANPMAREHALAKLDALLALGAEEIGSETAREAAARLHSVDQELKASLVLADDLAGGWTNRYTTEASVRFADQGGLARRFATGLLWTSESPAPLQIRTELLSAIYRATYQLRFGLPTTFRAMLTQEGLAAAFAGQTAVLSAADLDHVRSVIQHHLDATAYPLIFACLYGDAAAEQLGYPPLGLPPRAGFNLAIADAAARQLDPVRALEV
jgi:hypothetical protein